MPSAARTKFESRLLPDVDRLIETHRVLRPEGRGRRHFGHLTRSGVLMLCAGWELYVEEVLAEAARLLVDRCAVPEDLPKACQKHFARSVKGSKHELKVLSLAGDGWRAAYADYVRLDVGQLNSPKSGKIDILFSNWIGIERCSDCWPRGADSIDQFVAVRGDIAHRGADSDYVTRDGLAQFRRLVCDTVAETDNHIATQLSRLTIGRVPWRRTAPLP